MTESRQQTLDFEARLEEQRQRALWLSRANIREPLRKYLFAILAGKPAKTRGAEIFVVTSRELANRLNFPYSASIRVKLQRLRAEAEELGVVVRESSIASHGGTSGSKFSINWQAIQSLAAAVPSIAEVLPPRNTEKRECCPPATSPPCHDHEKNVYKNHEHDRAAQANHVATPKRSDDKPPSADGVSKNSFHGWPEEITGETLRDPVVVDRLYRHAIERKWIDESDATRLDFFATAVAARDGHTPGRLFTYLVKKKAWRTDSITQRHEAAASEILRSLAKPPQRHSEAPLTGDIAPAFLLPSAETTTPPQRDRDVEIAKLREMMSEKQAAAKGGPS